MNDSHKPDPNKIATATASRNTKPAPSNTSAANTRKEPLIVTPPLTVTPPPLHAAKGDDDLMSKQQQQSMPSVDEIKGKWKQHVGAAKIAWGRLTEDELLKSEGHAEKLAGLVQERYAITRDEAAKQVKYFFNEQES